MNRLRNMRAESTARRSDAHPEAFYHYEVFVGNADQVEDYLTGLHHTNRIVRAPDGHPCSLHIVATPDGDLSVVVLVDDRTVM